MKNSIKVILLLLFIVAGGELAAQDSLAVYDSIPVELREFDEAKLNEFKADDDFDYLQRNAGPSGISVWQMILQWFRDLISGILNFSIGNVSVGMILLYALIIAGMAFAIYQLIKMNTRRLFGSPDGDSFSYEISEENIHNLDFERLIKEAVDTRQYKRAIRLTYLFALKILSDSQDIHWEPGKTNHDYYYEIKEPEIRKGFEELGYFFEYAWYGEFDISESHYKEVKSIFQSWKKEAHT